MLDLGRMDRLPDASHVGDADLWHNEWLCFAHAAAGRCRSPEELVQGAACAHCGTPLSILDMQQAERLVAQLQKAEDRGSRPVDPTLPLELLRARRETERAFAGLAHEDIRFDDVISTDLVAAGLSARWFKNT